MGKYHNYPTPTHTQRLGYHNRITAFDKKAIQYNYKPLSLENIRILCHPPPPNITFKHTQEVWRYMEKHNRSTTFKQSNKEHS